MVECARTLCLFNDIVDHSFQSNAMKTQKKYSQGINLAEYHLLLATMTAVLGAPSIQQLD
jgi:hypothetical protein